MMTTTKIGLSDADESQAQDLLLNILANLFILTLKTRHYHWNVTGPQFQQYHELFERQYNDLIEEQDLIAERIRKLGAKVPATAQNFLNKATLKEEHAFPPALDMIKHLKDDHEAICCDMRQAIKKLEETADEGTIDMLIGRLQDHEEKAWMLRNHLDA